MYLPLVIFQSRIEYFLSRMLFGCCLRRMVLNHPCTRHRHTPCCSKTHIIPKDLEKKFKQFFWTFTACMHNALCPNRKCLDKPDDLREYSLQIAQHEEPYLVNKRINLVNKNIQVWWIASYANVLFSWRNFFPCSSPHLNVRQPVHVKVCGFSRTNCLIL